MAKFKEVHDMIMDLQFQGLEFNEAKQRGQKTVPIEDHIRLLDQFITTVKAADDQFDQLNELLNSIVVKRQNT